MPSLGVIIQARMGSTRLPAKVLKEIGNRNLLEHILFRLSYLKHNCEVVIATSSLKQDDEIADFCQKNSVSCFRGSEQNVLERYYLCSKKMNFNHIIRLTGDNPFTDIEELDNLICLHLGTGADYSRSFSSLPRGIGAEIFTFKALEKSFMCGNKSNHKEHVNEYIEENEDEFKISELNVKKEKNRPDISLTVDTLDDYKRACFVVENAASDYVNTEEAIRLCLQYV